MWLVRIVDWFAWYIYSYAFLFPYIYIYFMELVLILDTYYSMPISWTLSHCCIIIEYPKWIIICSQPLNMYIPVMKIDNYYTTILDHGEGVKPHASWISSLKHDIHTLHSYDITELSPMLQLIVMISVWNVHQWEPGWNFEEWSQQSTT